MQTQGTLGRSTKRLGTGDVLGYKTQYASMADCAQLANYTTNGRPEKMGTSIPTAAVPPGAWASSQPTTGECSTILIDVPHDLVLCVQEHDIHSSLHDLSPVA